MRRESDDQGSVVELGQVRRIVSLVPSLTEAVASTEPELLVGVTDWCTHPPTLTAERIGGTKNPDVKRIVALGPDLVLANEEENRAADLDALRAAGLPVWVTEVRTVAQALTSLDRMLTQACGLPRPAWLDRAASVWAAVSADKSEAVRAVVPIWRRPWMVLGRDTFAGDVLRRLGVRHVYVDHPQRYPAIALPELHAADPQLVVLPDEPYRFTADDGPESFPGTPCALVSGRHLTWYGPSLVDAPEVLRRQLRSTITR